MSDKRDKLAKSGLLRSTSVVAMMTMLSRILGLTRDISFGYLFGAAAGLDAFFVAFKIPNFLRRAFAEGSFSQAFVPVLSEYQTHDDEQALKSFLNHIAGTLGLILLVLSVVASLAAPWIIHVFAPGFSDDPVRLQLSSHMLRVTFPYILFISLTALAGGILNSYGRFGVPAFTPVILNVCLIGSAFYLAPHFQHGVEALAWGVFIAGCLQLLFQLPFLLSIKRLPKPVWGWNHPGVRKTLKLMVPTLIGSSVSQINLLFDTIFASFLPVGSVSWLYYSDRITQFPLGVFGIAISTVILPHLSRKHAASKSQQEYGQMLSWGIRSVLLVGLPASAALLILAGPVLTTLFQYGRFTGFDVMEARLSLMAFAGGLTAFMMVKVLSTGYFAKQDTKTPVKIAIVAMVTNTVLSLALIHSLRHAGLALATSLAAWLNVLLLRRGLKKRDVLLAESGNLRFLLQVIVAVMVMALALYFTQAGLKTWLAWHMLTRVWHLLLLVVLGIAVYFVVLFVLGVRPRHFRQGSL